MFKTISLIAHPVIIFPILIILSFDKAHISSLIVVSLLSFLVPFIHFLYLYKRKEISNFDVTKRTQRYKIYCTTLAGLTISNLYLYFFSTKEIFFEFSKLLTLAIVLVLINFKIKVSIHTALITVLCFVLVRNFQIHPAIFLLVPIIAYSRFTLKCHKPLELLLGALIPTLFYIW